jgi:iron(III) transport system ATP-binding protein
VQQGRPIDLYCRPKNRFVAEFFGEVNHIPATVQNRKIDTVFGVYDADEFEDGTKVQIVVRHEGLHLSPKSEGAIASVVETHLLGKNSLVHLSVPIGSSELHLHARIPGLSWFETGKNVFVEIDPEQVFIFPEQNR